MSELNFAKTFLQTLDAKPTKYPSSHVFDPTTFPTRIPFTLPRLPQPPHPPYPESTHTEPPPPGATPTNPLISLSLKSTRSPVINITLSNVNPSITTVAQLRESVQNELGGSTVVPAEKIKILHNRKPISASKKTISDLFEGQGDDMGNLVEMGVMIIGRIPDPSAKSGAAAQGSEVLDGTTIDTSGPPPAERMEGIEKASSPPPVQGARGREILETNEFWEDLQGYLEQRIKDEMEAARLVQRWKSSSNQD